MAVLGNSVLRQHLAAENIIVNPINADSVQPNSIDVRLGRFLKISDPDYYQVYDYKKGDMKYNIWDLVTDGPYLLEHGLFVLGMTHEFIGVPLNLTCNIEGKSSVGRFGLLIQNAGRVDSGWLGNLTLEILNMEKFLVSLQYKMPIGQLIFTEARGVTEGYGSSTLKSKYQGDVTPQESRLYKDYE